MTWVADGTDDAAEDRRELRVREEVAPDAGVGRDTDGRRDPGDDLEGNAGIGECPFGAHDALGERGGGGQKGARNLLGLQASQQPQGERCPALGRETG